MPTANGQQWFALAQRLVDQHEFKGVPLWSLSLNGLRDLARKALSVQFRVNVFTTRQQHSIGAAHGFGDEILSGRQGSNQGMAPAAFNANGYLSERLTEKSSNSTPLLSVDPEMRTQGDWFIGLETAKNLAVSQCCPH